jgi:formylglycine-generating enzyme required for sulfatase activity
LLGIEHERIHLETSSVLIRQLPISQVREHALWPACPHDAVAAIETNELLPVPARQLDLGKKHGHALYGWDNEYGDHSVHVPAFQASKYLCSNREFMKFVRAGGYENQSYWNDEGWRWKMYRKATHPVFWVAQADKSFRLRLMTKEVDMMWDWPVEVLYLCISIFFSNRLLFVDNDEYFLLTNTKIDLL